MSTIADTLELKVVIDPILLAEIDDELVFMLYEDIGVAITGTGEQGKRVSEREYFTTIEHPLIRNYWEDRATYRIVRNDTEDGVRRIEINVVPIQ